MSDFATARLNMVESQVRPNEVTDRRILQAMSEIPREAFVPPSMRTLAYMDEEIVLHSAGRDAPARHLMAPMPLARLIQLASVEAGDLVLDVGCATGYSTAVLARLAESVVGLECDSGLAETAGKTLMELEADNAAVVTGPLPEGYSEEGPYDAILLNGAVPDVPQSLLDQLKQGGRLVAVLSAGGLGKATLFQNIASMISDRPAFDAGAPALPGFERRATFVF
ncbi:MAG: protein-L-isoaspartate O-methyltransferase family protein [Methyloligellaceae bacterium]